MPGSIVAVATVLCAAGVGVLLWTWQPGQEWSFLSLLDDQVDIKHLECMHAPSVRAELEKEQRRLEDEIRLDTAELKALEAQLVENVEPAKCCGIHSEQRSCGLHPANVVPPPACYTTGPPWNGCGSPSCDSAPPPGLAPEAVVAPEIIPFRPESCRRAVEWYLNQPHLRTMVGTARRKISFALAMHVIRKGIPGDFLEAGVAEGGVAVLLLLVLSCYQEAPEQRLLWMADNWEGLPEKTHEADKADNHLFKGQFHVSYARFQAHLGYWVHFWNTATNKSNLTVLPIEQSSHYRIKRGLFSETLPYDDELKRRRLAFLRCDGDLYESIWDCLINGYPLLNPGGWVYVDDYWAFRAAQKAVDDFITQEGLPLSTLRTIDEFDDAMTLTSAACTRPAERTLGGGASLRFVARCIPDGEVFWKLDNVRIANAVIWEKK